MSNYESLKEIIIEELFEKEPLAMAIILYLNQTNPDARQKIVDDFSNIIDVRLDRLVKELEAEK